MRRFVLAAALLLPALVTPTQRVSASPMPACDSQQMLLLASLTDNLVNVAEKTHANEKKAVSFASRAVTMEKACMDVAKSPMEHGRVYLLMAHDMMLAAVATDEMGDNQHARVFANFSIKIWKEIASTNQYPVEIRKSAQKQIDASK